MQTLGEWARAQFDIFLLLALFAFLIHGNAAEYHEVLGALLLALTGRRNPRAPVAPTNKPEESSKL